MTRPDLPTDPARPSRRAFLSTGAIGLAGAMAFPQSARAQSDGTYTFEVTRTDAEWRERLTDAEFKILRGGDTELPKTNPLWNDYRAGAFACRGCDLPLYTSNWRVPLDKGWVFFAHAHPQAVMLGIDGPQTAYGMNPNGFANLTEVHCRRCGSHLGHLVVIEGELLHCINGTSLVFTPSEA